MNEPEPDIDGLIERVAALEEIVCLLQARLAQVERATPLRASTPKPPRPRLPPGASAN